MVEELSTDYANYVLNTNISREIQPICANIDEIILRVHEFESLLNLVKNDTQATREFLPQLKEFRTEFKDICERVDSFENLLRVISKNLTTLEKHVQVAGEELGYTETGLMGLLKPLFKEQRKPGELQATNLNSDQNYVPVEVFSAADYFPDSTSC